MRSKSDRQEKPKTGSKTANKFIAMGCFFTMFFVLTLAFAQTPKIYSKGLRLLPKEQYKLLPVAKKTNVELPIPLSIDLSIRMPPPGDQGSQGSCTAWAVAYAKSYHENIKQIAKHGDRRIVYSPSFIYNQIKIAGCKDGSSFTDALNLVVREGIVPMKDFPYNQKNCSTLPNNQVKKQALKHKSLTWKTLPLDYITKTNLAMSYLANALPIMISIQTHKSLDSYNGEGLYSPQDVSAEYHAMLIVGYNKNKNAYKVMNSWGQNWGDNGFLWVAPDTLRSITREAYIIYDKTEPQTPWGLYQDCLSKGLSRCCDHIGGDLVEKALLCGALPGLDRWTLYRWCTETGKPRCCDHLTKEIGQEKRVCGDSTEISMLEHYKQCLKEGKRGCCNYMTREVAQKYKVCIQ